MTRSLWKVLKNPRRAHSSADAHGHDSIPPVATLQFTQNRRRKFRAGASQRMSQRHRAAIGIDLIWIKPGFLDDRKRLRRERFIQLHEVDLIDLVELDRKSTRLNSSH